jgi:hypothetical protein
VTHNVEVTGAARLYRAASVWTAGLGTQLRYPSRQAFSNEVPVNAASFSSAKG